MTVLVWGLPHEATTASVCSALARIGVPLLVLDQRRVLSTSARLDLIPPDAAVTEVTVDGVRHDLGAVSAAYLRPYDSTQVSAVRDAAPGTPRWQHALAVDDVLYTWAELTAAFVVTRPSAGASNGSKPCQLTAIAAAGFAVPPTVAGNDPRSAAAFRAEHGDVVCKSTSGVRSRVRRVGATEPLDDVGTSPTQLQHRIRGTDVRVHVVGDRLFATQILSEADDYRYAARQGLPRPGLRPTTIPDDVAQRCLRLAHGLGLPVAGIDLRRTDAGRWYCFEVNPSPAFGYYEAATGQPVAAAVAGLLAAVETCHPRAG